MGRKLNLKPEVETKLRELGILTRFQRNCQKVGIARENTKNEELWQKYAENAYTLRYAIRYAFVWSETPEGFDYWEYIETYGKLPSAEYLNRYKNG